MSVNRGILAALALAAAISGVHTPASGRDALQASLGLDRFVAGGTVRHVEAVAGDVIAVGGDVEIDATVEGNAIVTGGTLRIAPLVGHDIYAAGGKILVEAHVGRSARLAGGRVELGSRAQVDGNFSAAAGEVVIRGPVRGHVQAAAGSVLIDSAVDGDVNVVAGSLELGPGARIGGKVHYRSGDTLRVDPAARVAGGIERGAPYGTRPRDRRVARETSGGGWVWTVGLMVLAAVMAAAIPAASQRVGAEMRARPGWSLLIGFIVLASVPVATLLLMITIIGLPLALLVLLAYFALLLVGYVATAVALGDGALRRWRTGSASTTGWRIAAAMLAVVALALLGRVPFVGFVVAFAAMLAGIGAILMSFTHRVAPPQSPPPP